MCSSRERSCLGTPEWQSRGGGSGSEQRSVRRVSFFLPCRVSSSFLAFSSPPSPAVMDFQKGRRPVSYGCSPSSFSPRSSSPHASTSSPTKTKPPEQSLYSPRTDLEAHSLLLVLSVLGCLIRLGLNALFAYPGQEVFALVWAQGVGCLVMGVCVARKEEIERWVGKGW